MKAKAVALVSLILTLFSFTSEARQIGTSNAITETVQNEALNTTTGRKNLLNLLNPKTKLGYTPTFSDQWATFCKCFAYAQLYYRRLSKLRKRIGTLFSIAENFGLGFIRAVSRRKK